MIFPSDIQGPVEDTGTVRGLYGLTKEELKTLYELLEHQYINYENIAAIQLIRKIRDILND
jgi:hypothetical protein